MLIQDMHKYKKQLLIVKELFFCEKRENNKEGIIIVEYLIAHSVAQKKKKNTHFLYKVCKKNIVKCKKCTLT